MRNKPEHLPVDDQSMILWDVVTSTKLRSFPWDRRETPPADTVKYDMSVYYRNNEYFLRICRRLKIEIRLFSMRKIETVLL